MINDIELAKSGSAKCKKCGKKIGLKTPRGIKWDTQSYGTSESYYCYKCTEENIDESISGLKDLKRRLKKMIKQNQQAIILQNL